MNWHKQHSIISHKLLAYLIKSIKIYLFIRFYCMQNSDRLNVLEYIIIYVVGISTACIYNIYVYRIMSENVFLLGIWSKPHGSKSWLT